MEQQTEYAKAALNIEREGEKASKRIETFADVRSQLAPFFDELFEAQHLVYSDKITFYDRIAILKEFAAGYDPLDDGQLFFDKIKEIGTRHGFAAAVKDYKKNPSAFKGHVGDIAGVVRVALFGSDRSPDLFRVAQVLGTERVNKRCTTLANG
jgi:glutamyl-tRNA synthetase